MALFGKDIFPAYFRLKELEYNSIEENEKIQKDLLEKIVIHSWKYSPYYKKVFEEAGVVDNGVFDFSNWSNVEFLTKDLINENWDDLQTTSDPQFSQRGNYENSSGGSTGKPVKFIQHRSHWIRGMACKWLFFSFIDDYPTKHIKLWGSERDILEGRRVFSTKIRNFIYRRRVQNAFLMSSEDVERYVEEINKFEPVFIEAYVQSIYELSKYIKEHDLEVYSPKGVVTSAGTLYPEIQDLIEEVFGCPVLNRYGSREVGDMACSCDKDEGLHLNIFQHYFEILNDEMKPCRPGEIGKVYITSLSNFSMPIIRYEIGDVAIPSENKECSCGRGLPLIASVKGRSVNLFKKADGTLVDGEYFTHMFYFKDWVQQFQVIQKDYVHLIMKIRLKGDKNEREIKQIEHDSRVVMGEDCCIEWEFIEGEIPPTKSGKYLYTISEVE
jgi:phenylacetate-CoA ligase